MAAQTGFLKWAISRACPVASARVHRPWHAGASVTCPAGAEDGRVIMGELDAVRLSWTSWDMIQKMRRADQAHSGTTDATRTERGFHAAGKGEIAGQRVFRWAGRGSL